MVRICTVVIALFCFSFSHAQTITVTDAHTGEPLELVTLVSKHPRVMATTNAYGQVNIGVFAESDEIHFMMLGFENLVMGFGELVDAGSVIHMKRSAFSMDEVVISGSRWNTPLQHNPARITSISPEQILRQNPATAADMLGNSGEVFIQKSQLGGGSPMIRGFATNRLLYVVDGIRMNTAIFRSGNLQNVISLDPFTMQSAEVLFGPGSVMYGSDAIGGVMNFQTREAQLAIEDSTMVSGRLITRFASAGDERTGHADFNIGWKTWALHTSFTSNRFGDLRMGSNGPDEYLRPVFVQRINGKDVVTDNPNPLVQRPTAYSQVNLMQKVRFEPNRHWRFDYGFHYSTTSDYPRYDRHLRTRDGMPQYGEWSYGPQQWRMHQLAIRHTANLLLYDVFTLRLAQQSFKESRISRNFNDSIRETRTEAVQAYSLNADFAKTLGQRHELFYGLEAVVNDVLSVGEQYNMHTGYRSPGPSRYPDATWQSAGMYITDHYELNHLWTLEAGVRYNGFAMDATFDTTFYPFDFTRASLENGALTGSFGTVYRPSRNWQMSANLATGFRSPNVDDMGKVFDSEPGAVVVPNPSLDAEYAYNMDLGMAGVVSGILKWDLTGYYTLLDQALVRRNFVLNGKDSILYDGELSQIQAIQNAAETRVYGVQAGIEMKLPAGFTFASRFNYQHGEEEQNDGTVGPSRHAAPWFGVSKVKYRAEKLEMVLAATLSGEKSFKNLAVSEQNKAYLYAEDAGGNPYSPSWYTLDLRTLYHLNQNFTLTAALENMTDQRYRTYSSGIAAPGRNFVLSVQAAF